MCDCECNKTCKNDEYVDIKNLSFVKHLVSKLVLECEDEILNATETFNKKGKMLKKVIALLTQNYW